MGKKVLDPADVSARFPARLKELRLGAGLSQRELAGRAGVSQGLVSAYESGEYAPSWSVVVSLAFALGVDYSAFAAKPGGSS